MLLVCVDLPLSSYKKAAQTKEEPPSASFHFAITSDS